MNSLNFGVINREIEEVQGENWYQLNQPSLLVFYSVLKLLVLPAEDGRDPVRRGSEKRHVDLLCRSGPSGRLGMVDPEMLSCG